MGRERIRGHVLCPDILPTSLAQEPASLSLTVTVFPAGRGTPLFACGFLGTRIPKWPVGSIDFQFNVAVAGSPGSSISLPWEQSLLDGTPKVFSPNLNLPLLVLDGREKNH